jgi:hypothetical protein
MLRLLNQGDQYSSNEGIATAHNTISRQLQL